MDRQTQNYNQRLGAGAQQSGNIRAAPALSPPQVNIRRLYDWAAQPQVFRSTRDLIPTLVRRLSTLILGQYFFEKNIPPAAFPINHIKSVLTLRNATINKEMADMLDVLTSSATFGKDERQIYDLIYQYSIYFQLKVLEYRLLGEVEDQTNMFENIFRELTQELKRRREKQIEVPVNLTSTDLIVQNLLEATLKFDDKISRELSTSTALIAPDLASFLDDVTTLNFGLDIIDRIDAAGNIRSTT